MNAILNGSRRNFVLTLARISLSLALIFGFINPAQAAAGDLDITFGVVTGPNRSGTNYTDISSGAGDVAYAIALQSTGEIVVAGSSNGAFAVARYDTSGNLDTTFNTTGFTTTSIQVYDTAYAVAVQPDSKIVVAGTSNNGLRDYFALARYNSNGSLDSSFGTSGIVTSTIGLVSDTARGLALQSDGKIVVVGWSNADFAVARYNSNGTLDTTGFGAPNGYVTTDFLLSTDRAYAVAIQSDGKIVVAGFADNTFSDDFALVRYNTDGSLDTSFGASGKVFTDFNSFLPSVDQAYSIALQPDGKIVAAGISQSATDDFAIARYTNSGALDTTFATTGMLTTTVGTLSDQAFGLAIQPTGRIVVAGMSADITTVQDLAIARFTSAGVLDTTFQSNGLVTTNVGTTLPSGGSTEDFAYAIAIQSDNKIVLAGYTDYPLATGDQNFLVARYDSPNNAPTVSAVSKSGSEDNDVTFTASDFSSQFSDPDSDSLMTVKITSLPSTSHGTLLLSSVAVTAGQEISQADLGNLVFHPVQDWNGNTSFGWNGSDGLDYAAAGSTVSITLSAVNDAPINSVPGGFSVNEDSDKTGLIFSISDVDAGSAPDFRFTLSASNGNITLAGTSGLTPISGGSGTHAMVYSGTLSAINTALNGVTYRGDANFTGADILTLTSNDQGNSGSGGVGQDSDNVSVTVDPVNDAPVLDAIGNKSVDEGSTLNFTASASDIENDNLNYTLDSGSPSGATINANSGLFSWTPSEAQGPGSYQVTVRVADDGTPSLDDFETITVTVSEVNAAPILGAIGDQTVDEGSNLSFTAGASDSDAPANSLTYSLDPGSPSGAAINPTSGAFSWTPTEAQGPGSYQITLRVTDDGSPTLDDFETITVTVAEINSAPILGAIGNQLAYEDTQLAFTAGVSDSDVPANTLTFSLDPAAPAGASIGAASGVFTWTPVEADANNTYTLTVRVTDNGTPTLDDFEKITIEVFPVNDAPSFTGGGNQIVDEDAGLQTVAAWAQDISTGSAGEASQVLSFTLSSDNPSLFASMPTVDALTGDLTYTPADDAYGTATITATLKDNGGTAFGGSDSSAPYNFSITVNPVNDAPVVSNVDMSGPLNQEITFSLADFTAAFNDVDGDSLLLIKITSLPAIGTLKLSGVDVTAGTELVASDVVISQLVYAPPSGYIGAASFNWNGEDGTTYAISDGTVNLVINGQLLYLPLLGLAP